MASGQSEGNAGTTVMDAEKIQMQLDKRRAFLHKWQMQLATEQDMLVIGRQQMNKDVKRHQAVMLESIATLKEKAKEDRKTFTEEVAAKVADLKLPSADHLFGIRNEELLEKLKKQQKDCMELLGNQMGSGEP